MSECNLYLILIEYLSKNNNPKLGLTINYSHTFIKYDDL